MLAALLLAGACAGDDLSTEAGPGPVATGGSSAGGQAGASTGGQAGAAGGRAGSSGTSGQAGAPGQGGSIGQGGGGQGGMSGSSGQPGEAGAAGETSGAAGDAGMGGSSGDTGGAAGASAGAAGAAGACDPGALYYADDDGDGHGNPAKSQMGCMAAGSWVATKDDCDDTNPDVFGGQTSYFDKPYPRAGFPDGLSFDYDCNNQEEHDPGVQANSCSGASLECPKKGGAVATKRTGTGVDSLCGSETKVECKGTLSGCQESSKAVIAPVRCR